MHMLWTPVPRVLTLPEGERERCWQFLMAVADSREEAERSWGAGLALAAAGSLHAVHVRAWAARWDGCGVELDGPLALRKALRGGLYYLLSAIPPQGSPGFPFHGISPGGLSNGTRGEDYWGHVFWDQVRGGLGALCTGRGLRWGLLGLLLSPGRDSSAPASRWDHPPAPAVSPAQPRLHPGAVLSMDAKPNGNWMLELLRGVRGRESPPGGAGWGWCVRVLAQGASAASTGHGHQPAATSDRAGWDLPSSPSPGAIGQPRCA